MIKKDLDVIPAPDKFSQAGINAERQMAFYLKRHFEHNSDVYILNDIRIGSKDDHAQIDHLVLHRHGMIVIESKSVTGEVKVNQRGEWSRHFGIWEGMPSPIEQAKRQGEFLMTYLDTHCPDPPRTLGVRRKYAAVPIDFLVAISDRALIQRPDELDNVWKADQIPSKVDEIVERYRQEDKLFSLAIILSNELMEQISTFLVRGHHPYPANARPSVAVLPAVRQPARQYRAYRCRKCGSTRIRIVWGGHNYYFKCNDCCGSTPIDERCPKCNRMFTLHKQKEKFFAECESCGDSRLFFSNPAERAASRI